MMGSYRFSEIYPGIGGFVSTIRAWRWAPPATY